MLKTFPQQSVKDQVKVFLPVFRPQYDSIASFCSPLEFSKTLLDMPESDDFPSVLLHAACSGVLF